MRRKRSLKLRIPAGIQDGVSLVKRGEGEPGMRGGPAGDLYITVTVKPHRLFKRDGNNILLDMPISITQAALGAEIDVPTLEKPVKQRIPEGTQTGTQFRIKGQGIPSLKNGLKGDLILTVHVEVPRKLNERLEGPPASWSRAWAARNTKDARPSPTKSRKYSTTDPKAQGARRPGRFWTQEDAEVPILEWLEAVVHTTTFGSDLVSDEMMALGAAGTEIVDRADVPDPRQPGVYWELYDPAMIDAMPDDVLVKAWFERGEKERETIEAVRAHLEQLRAQGGADLGTLRLELSGVKDEDWSENWKKYYKPFRIGTHLVVKPTWEAYQPSPEDLIIELDPGMAFGTGTHETTSMCMQLLEKHLKSDMRVMDVGTGSGILAIAAARLGAKEVLAIDIDPAAVKVARENIVLNHVEDRVRAVEGDLCKSEAMPCDLAVANIVADAIRMLAAPLTRHLAKGGLLICSGIIREREQDVLDAALAAGYVVADRLEKGEWVALALRNEAA